MIHRLLIIFLVFKKLNMQIRISKLIQNDGRRGLTRDNIINAGDDCFVHFGLVVFCCKFVVDGPVPDKLLYSTIMPILKGKQGNFSSHHS